MRSGSANELIKYGDGDLNYGGCGTLSYYLVNAPKRVPIIAFVFTPSLQNRILNNPDPLCNANSLFGIDWKLTRLYEYAKKV